MADKPINTAKVKLYDGSKLIGEWIAKDGKIITINDRTIAFIDLDTKKLIQVSGTYVVERDNTEGWFV